MIFLDLSLPVKQLRIDTYYFTFLMLVLVIPQIETSVIFVFSLRLHIVSGVTRIICKEIGFLKVLRNPSPFGPVPWQKLELVRTLVAAC